MIRRLRAFSRRLALTINLVVVACILLSYLATQISPEKFPYLAFFGIAYGFLLVSNIVFVIFWLLVKKRFALISAGAILIGFNFMASYIQLLPDLTSTEIPSRAMKVVSQNVKLFGWYNWSKNIANRDDMMRKLELSEGDIFCFQEYFHNSSPGIFETKELLKLTLNAPYVYDEYTSTVGKNQHYGIATFSKFPIINQGKIEFKSERNNNMCIFIDVQAYGDTVRIYNVHAASIRFSQEEYAFIEKINEDKQEADIEIDEAIGIVERLANAYSRRAQQISLVKAHSLESPHPVVICGDFNDTPVSYTYATISDNLIDTYRESGGFGLGSTYLGAFPSFRIDYIFHSKGLDSSDYYRYEERISDHNAISALIWTQ
ncbi:MAG: endonuclease/exonuclease/phosphatase family protein [Flavobacteriales bacterium]|nr:endonuclease/exonuclease/phosphatase family protein [Flavobacteriales bacterium]